MLANSPGRVPFIVDPANACTTWLQSFLAKVRGLSIQSTGRETRKHLARTNAEKTAFGGSARLADQQSTLYFISVE